MGNYSGKQKIEFCKRLGNNWEELADYFDIPDSFRKQYARVKRRGKSGLG